MQPRVDKESAAKRTVLTVKHSMLGSWEVRDTALDKPLAAFDQREQALDFARGLAATKPAASVQTFDQWGEPEMRESYVLDAASGRTIRAS